MMLTDHPRQHLERAAEPQAAAVHRSRKEAKRQARERELEAERQAATESKGE